jgi:hypothetical protein
MKAFESIKVDFLADVVGGMTSQLAAWGHSVPPGADQQTVASLFANLQRRRIEPRPRAVHVARDLVCSESFRGGFELVTRKLRRGDDVTAHLSRTVHDSAEFNDMVLNDWGFHHLHLGTSYKSDGLIERTGALLFVHVQRDAVYCVAIGDHDDWAAKRLNDAVFNSWPELYAGRTFSLSSGHGSTREWSEDEHQKLRKAGVLVVVRLPDGRLALPLGGGYATSQRSIDVTRRVGRVFEETAELERRFATMAPTIAERLAAAGLDVSTADFHLRQAANGAFLAVDDRFKVSVVLFESQDGRSHDESNVETQ